MSANGHVILEVRADVQHSLFHASPQQLSDSTFFSISILKEINRSEELLFLIRHQKEL